MNDPKPSETVPRHVAVIMDGNGRWAAKRRLGRIRGHREGVKAVRRVVQAAASAGVGYLTLFTFSTENWGRPATEVTALMELLAKNLKSEVPDLIKNGVRVRIIGDRTKLPANTVESIMRTEEETAGCERLTLILAISYGGREEILNAAKKLVESGIQASEVNERNFRSMLYAPDIPDPDLLIRTSGEHRISNFLLWQLAYTEIHVTDVLWPDFGPDDFAAALEDYAGRKRRFGLTDEQTGRKQ